MPGAVDVEGFRRWIGGLPIPIFNSRVGLAKSALHGRGLHAKKELKAGEIIVFDQGVAVHESVVALGVALLGHENALRIDWETYALDAPIDGGAYINHSCDPNVGFTGARTLVTIRDVRAGEELFLDYGTSEVWREWSMSCRCGTSLCRKKISGRDHELPELRERLGRWFSPFLRRHWGLEPEPAAGDAASPLERWVSALPEPTISSRVALRPSTIHGQGLHAVHRLEAGEIVVVDQGVEVDNSIVALVTNSLNHQNDLAVDWNRSLLDRSVQGGAYANHSCEPTIGLANERTFVTLCEIDAGTELCPDYATFGADPEWTMICRCGMPTCRGAVRGRDHENEEFRRRLGRWFSPYLKAHWQL